MTLRILFYLPMYSSHFRVVVSPLLYCFRSSWICSLQGFDCTCEKFGYNTSLSLLLSLLLPHDLCAAEPRNRIRLDWRLDAMEHIEVNVHSAQFFL